MHAAESIPSVDDLSIHEIRAIVETELRRRAKVAESRRGKWASAETRRRISEAALAQHARRRARQAAEARAL